MWGNGLGCWRDVPNLRCVEVLAFVAFAFVAFASVTFAFVTFAFFAFAGRMPFLRLAPANRFLIRFVAILASLPFVRSLSDTKCQRRSNSGPPFALIAEVKVTHPS